MKWISVPGLITSMACALSSFPCFAAAVSNEVSDMLGGSTEFDSQQIDFAQYEMLLGPVVYQYPASPDEVEGFRAQDSRLYEGRISRRVLDFQPNVGSLKVFDAIEDTLHDQGFKIGFSCEGVTCGSVKGWGVFFPRQSDSVMSDQFFISASFPEEGPPERLVSAHVSRVGEQARVTIDEVDLLIDVDRAIENYANSLMTFWSDKNFERGLAISGYPLGSAELTNTMKLKYKAIARIIDNNPGLSLSLFGYTDRIGAEVANEDLSKVRAESVFEYLESLGVPKDLMDHKGLGMFEYTATFSTEDVAPQHRKVVVVPGSANALSSLN